MSAGTGPGRDPQRDAGPARGPAPDEGGEPVCWLHRVCPACGRIADEDPPTRCPACGEALPAD